MEHVLGQILRKGQSALILGPRQTGKTFLAKACLTEVKKLMEYPLQDPGIRMEMERDAGVLIRQVEAQAGKPVVFVDEAQKVPELFDSAQYLIDENKASFIITGSSARKLRRKGVNLLPGRIRTFRLDPLQWNEFGWQTDHDAGLFRMPNINAIKGYSFEHSLIYGSLPGIVNQPDDKERVGLLKSYTQTYLEEEIRAEALSRKIGPFSRFLELAAQESGTNPNLTKLSLESGVSVPTIKEYFNILEDTLVVEKVEPYLKNARKRILTSPRYYFFDLGVRNALARVPLTEDLLNVDKGRLFEHAVILELIRRIRTQNLDYKVHYWRTGGGAEVDCVIDTGATIIPIEIKAGSKVTLTSLRGLSSFLETYKGKVKKAYVITTGRMPEKLTDTITALPWKYL
ncbi:MAG: ATP-binding protein [Nitrospirota bacterium]|nr:ATP-binding protein [Nitrospirota bacterium]